MSEKHTPTPWVHGHGLIWAASKPFGDSDGWVVGDDIDMSDKDGRFIVRACNRDPLFERMRGMLKELEDFPGALMDFAAGTRLRFFELLRDIEAEEKEEK